MAEGWRGGVGSSLADGILTRDEEERWREFRDRFTFQAPGDAESALGQGACDRVMLDARLTALSASGGDTPPLQESAGSVRELGLMPGEERDLLVQAWEAAVEGSLEDGVLSLDE